jgi:hypothetical protein
MALPLKQSTASQEVPLGPFVDSTDGSTAETGLTIANTDIKIWVNGATSLANKNSGGGTHMAQGVYSAVLDATDTATLGPLVIFVQVAGALPVRLECVVLNAVNYDSAIAGTDFLQVDAVQFAGQTITAGAGVTMPSAVASTTNITAGTITTATNVTTVNGLAANVITATSIATDAITAAKIAADAIGASELAADAVAEIQSGLATAAALTIVDDFLDTEIAAIKAKTDSLTFTVANVLDANIQRVNDVAIVGDGAGTPWGP